MYGLPSDFDASVFVGLELEEICFSVNTVSLRFDPQTSITIDATFVTRDGGGRETKQSPPVQSSADHDFLGTKGRDRDSNAGRAAPRVRGGGSISTTRLRTSRFTFDCRNERSTFEEQGVGGFFNGEAPKPGRFGISIPCSVRPYGIGFMPGRGSIEDGATVRIGLIKPVVVGVVLMGCRARECADDLRERLGYSIPSGAFLVSCAAENDRETMSNFEITAVIGGVNSRAELAEPWNLKQGNLSPFEEGLIAQWPEITNGVKLDQIAIRASSGKLVFITPLGGGRWRVFVKGVMGLRPE